MTLNIEMNVCIIIIIWFLSQHCCQTLTSEKKTKRFPAGTAIVHFETTVNRSSNDDQLQHGASITMTLLMFSLSADFFIAFGCLTTYTTKMLIRDNSQTLCYYDTTSAFCVFLYVCLFVCLYLFLLRPCHLQQRVKCRAAEAWERFVLVIFRFILQRWR